jgi:hypothetical protein
VLVQEIENFARSGNSRSKEVVQKAFENLYERYGRLPYVEKLEFDYLDGNLGEKEFKNKILDIANSTEETGLKGYLHDIYKLLHGEAEARLTQKRAIDGYENFPLDDLDVPRDELIKKFDGGVAEMAKELESRYIKNDKILESELMKDALELPKPIKTYKKFTNMLSKKDNEYFIKTPVGDISLDARYRFSHFTDNTHFDDREYISGAFLETLADPLFVVAKKHKGKENLVFYKPFKDEKGKYHLASFTIDDEHKTFFELDNLGKVKGLIKSSEKDMRYFKHSQANSMLDTEQLSLSKSVYDRSISKDYKDSQGFYSVLEKTIDEKVGGKIDSSSLKNMLEKNGVKQDEIEWSGLKELMESKEKLTKEEIEETIKSNRLVVEIVESEKTDIREFVDKFDKQDRKTVVKMINEKSENLT